MLVPLGDEVSSLFSGALGGNGCSSQATGSFQFSPGYDSGSSKARPPVGSFADVSGRFPAWQQHLTPARLNQD